jgi:hypothetical protein
MKAKLKTQTPENGVIIGANSWDGTVTINGKSYQPGREYEITKYELETGLFDLIEAPKPKRKKKNE